jgi:hypothetical protein
MSLDEMGRASARRATQTFTTSYDVSPAYRELVAVQRRRARAKVVGGSAAVLAVLLAIVVGAGVTGRHRTEPAAPRPSTTKQYLAAPPLCGPQSIGSELSQYVDVGHSCPNGPGRYLSLLMGIGSNPPFAFTLPSGWTVRGLGGVGGGDVRPALGGLWLQPPHGGHGLVLAEFPTEIPAFSRYDGSGEAPGNIAARLATRDFVQPTDPVRSSLGGRAAWRINLVQREEASTDGICVTGNRCGLTFGLGGEEYPGRSFIGVVPGLPSTAYVLYGRGNRILTVAWTFGDPDTDHDLGQVLASIDLDPPLYASGAASCASLTAPFVGTWHTSVTTREAGAKFNSLVGDWSLILRHDGSARLVRSDGKRRIDGGWSLDGTDLLLGLDIPGCVTDTAEYRPSFTTPHRGLDLVPIESQESCPARSLILGSHWG